jgi:anti-sigma regulatory factor (Ser/Thr protein kinase)
MKAEYQGEARLENLGRFRDFVEQACLRAGGDAAACFDLKLAVDEACTNIVLHGYPGREAGSIELEIEQGTETMTVTIIDHGLSFCPDALPASDVTSSWQNRRAGGLGWHLIRRVTDGIEYHADEERGNRLVLVKRLKRREDS